MKIIRSILLFILLALSIFSGFETYHQEQEKLKLKLHLVELSKVKYGIFNVDEWKKIMAEIISKKIEEFNLEGVNRDEMRIKITNFLTVAIDELEERYYEDKTQSIVGILESGIAYATGTFGQIKKDIPVFTEQILDFLNEKENRDAIRSYLIKKLNEYADDTFSKTDYSEVSKIFNEYQTYDIVQTRNLLQHKIEEVRIKNQPNKLILIVVAFLVLVILIVAKDLKIYDHVMNIVLAFVFLTLGVLLPMIEIDARISELSFSLLGESVGFSDQVLYYKSKSILEVVHLMVLQSRIDLIAVGILVLLFSVIFPVTKLVCSIFYLLNKKFRKKPFVSFMVFKSGKWSMADVFVLAIFMAYIGFDGIISEQLKQLESLTQNIELLTTNQSNLLFGFFSFSFFVIMSLFVSQKIRVSITKKENGSRN